MSYNTDFSRELLRLARQDAKAFGVKIPRGLTALHSSGNQWFVQGHDDPGDYVRADNAFHARAQRVWAIIYAIHPQLAEEQELAEERAEERVS